MMVPKSILDVSRQVQSGELDVVEFIEAVLEELDVIDKKYQVLAAACRDTALKTAKGIRKAVAEKKAKGRLLGVPVSVKDCICVQGVESRAGSGILNGYRPVFDATAIARLKREGAVIIGKTVQDEFGFGSFCTNVGKGFRIPKNPVDPSRVTGGSSGGAAALTRLVSFPHLAVAESTGGSIVAPAGWCGVAGLCPTYGLVSRYGLIDYANSLDKIGTMAKTMSEAYEGLRIMAGFDPKDATSVGEKSLPPKQVKGLRVGVLDQAFGRQAESAVQTAVKDAVETLRLKGAVISEVSLPKTEQYGLAAYYVLAMAESSTNLAKYCGMRYGQGLPLSGMFDEYFAKVRSAHLGQEAKRRIMLGTFARMAGFRDAYYLRAARVRSAIIQEYKALFGRVDVIVSPAMPIRAPKQEDVARLSPLKQYAMDALTVGPNLCGLPHASAQVKGKGLLPVGLMVVGNHFEESTVASACREVERE